MGENEDWTYRPAADVDLQSVERMRSVRREGGLVSSIAHAATAQMLRAYFLLYHRFTVNGSEHFPHTPPFVVIANHSSHLDALILAAALPKAVRAVTYPVAAGDVFFTSPHRSVFSSMLLNALPLWRKKVTAHALVDLRQRLAQGDCGLILFPEGARSRDGTMLPFKPGLGMLVAASSVPVVPCYIDGALKALRPGRWLPVPSRLKLRVGSALEFNAVTDDREGWTQVAARAAEAVRALGEDV